MDTRNSLNTRRHMRGAGTPVTVAIIAVIVLLAIGAWFLIIKPHQDLVLQDAGGHPSTPVTASTISAPPPANVAAMDETQLLSEARNAVNQQRYLSPAGNNAFEFYLRALEVQPGNKVASDALRETFPIAAGSAEQAINARNFDDAQRQIALLAKADPTNFTLTILRSKLDAQRKTLDKQQQQEADQQKAQALAAQQAVADKAAAGKLAEQQKLQLAEQQRVAAQAASRAAQQPERSVGSTAASASQTTAVAAGGKTSPAVLTRQTQPHYPPRAARAQQEGSVLVSFTVTPEGRTSDVKIVESQPKRIFDRAAIDAVEGYRFTPAMRDGVAVPSQRQQSIEFKLK
ncbi:MAG: energy transducer TonB [Rhodanobacter sp.]